MTSFNNGLSAFQMSMDIPWRVVVGGIKGTPGETLKAVNVEPVEESVVRMMGGSSVSRSAILYVLRTVWDDSGAENDSVIEIYLGEKWVKMRVESTSNYQGDLVMATCGPLGGR